MTYTPSTEPIIAQLQQLTCLTFGNNLLSITLTNRLIESGLAESLKEGWFLITGKGVGVLEDLGLISNESKKLSMENNYVPYQLCPKCLGVGKIQYPMEYQSTSPYMQCDVCNGAKIIPMCSLNSNQTITI